MVHKRTKDFTLGKDSSVPLMFLDPMVLGLFSKETQNLFIDSRIWAWVFPLIR